MPTFTNTATLSYNGGTVNSNTVSGTIQEVLSITKTAVNNNYSVGDNVTYVVSLLNTGTAPFTNVTLTDDMGGFLCNTSTVYPLEYNDGTVRYYVNGILQEPPAVTENGSVVFSGLTVPAEGNAMLVYEATVTPSAPPQSGGLINNVVTANGTGIPASLTDTATISALDEPQLTISKAVCPSVVSANGTLTYTFTIQNTGNVDAVATDNIVVTDTFDPAINITSVTYNGTPWTSPANYTYSNITGQFATVLGQITVPAATYEQDAACGWTVTPGVSTITVTGTIQ
ncbi:MAG: DUF11 domain-containing protein [Ruminococcaceae bacterium]|nr:DUF11 domain-containing protein [Oscillospiraceae bacterium]